MTGNPFGDFYRGKTVLVTGHSGFKGSWLTMWLTTLGANVIGYALEPPTDPCIFTACHLAKRITHIHGDVRDYALLEQTFREHQPEIVFHLAAQSLVRVSFSEPRRTFEVNLMGTVNVLEVARQTDSVRAVVAITSDKCYRNVGWEWGYRETDELGGYDPYSASKACEELIIAAYQDPRFQQSAYPRSDLPIASARAANVIGGGDWARDRIVPDTIRAITSNTAVVVRNPEATRPWQHALEPLSGYLLLGFLLAENRDRYCSAWNFGPRDQRALQAAELVTSILARWPAPTTRLIIKRDESEAEPLVMRLDSSKANYRLKWHSTWTIDQTLDAVVAWYERFHDSGDADMYSFSIQQIEEYTHSAKKQDLHWAQS